MIKDQFSCLPGSCHFRIWLLECVCSFRRVLLSRIARLNLLRCVKIRVIILCVDNKITSNQVSQSYERANEEFQMRLEKSLYYCIADIHWCKCKYWHDRNGRSTASAVCCLSLRVNNYISCI